jgi:hypothetical protein
MIAEQLYITFNPSLFHTIVAIAMENTEKADAIIFYVWLEFYYILTLKCDTKPS